MLLIVLCAQSIAFSEFADTLIRGIYINPYQASSIEFMDRVFAWADSGAINTIMVDLKSDYGFLSYDSKLDFARKLDAVKRYIKLDALIARARDHNVKLIARIVCFRDNYTTKDLDYALLDKDGKAWRDFKNMAWANPYCKKMREYLLEITKEIVNLGIKSVAYDYIRFPSDGDLSNIVLSDVTGSRDHVLHEFLKSVKKEVMVEIGICIFGFAVWHPLRNGGQDIAEMGKYVDMVFPMLYPSHFGDGFKRWDNDYWRNYWIYYDSVIRARQKLPDSVQLIPYVQGFDFKADTFNSDYVYTQIMGSIDAGASGVFIWNAGCDYSVSWEPLSWARNSYLRRYVQNYLNSHRKEAGQRYQDIDLESVLAQLKIQMRNQTMFQSDNQFDIQPLKRIRKFDPDQLIP